MRRYPEEYRSLFQNIQTEPSDLEASSSVERIRG